MGVGCRKLGKASRVGNARGFTLPELLVSIAIFISVMGGVSLLFVNSMRLMRQGFQNQEAFELARSTLKIIERDLTRAFTSREHGDFYNFYGTPIGFTFVGLVSSREDSVPNLARVTYVVYHGPEPENVITVDEQTKQVYKLLRYIEPGAEDLDDFPVRWYDYRLRIPEPTGNFDSSLGGLLDFAISEASIALGTPCGTCSAQNPVELSAYYQEIVAAKKRELWIRALSGGDDLVPSAWDDDNFGLRPQFEGWINLGNKTSTFIEDVDDYVVAENIFYTAFQGVDLSANGVDDDLDGMVDESFFNGLDDDGDLEFDENDEIGETEVGYRPDFAPGYIGYYPQLVPGEQAGIMSIDPQRPPMYFFTYIDLESLIIDDGTGVIRRQLVPVTLRYWNDLRNIELEIPANGRDDDFDGFIDETLTESGSPLYPRLPVEVTTHFELFFEAPYTNTQDFRKAFEQRIDLPTGIHRHGEF